MKNETGSTFGRELNISRLLHAPAELVWEVWTKPEHIKNWWGPNGFTNTIHKMDFRESGELDFIMHGPNGENYPQKNLYREIIEHKKIVYEHFNPNFIATIKFESRGDKTFLNWHMLFETKELFEAVVKTYKADKGLKENVEKMERYLSLKNIQL